MWKPFSSARKRCPASSPSYFGSSGGNHGLSGDGGGWLRGNLSALATAIVRNNCIVTKRRTVPANVRVRTLMANSARRALERDIRAGDFQLVWTCRILRTLAPLSITPQLNKCKDNKGSEHTPKSLKLAPL